MTNDVLSKCDEAIRHISECLENLNNYVNVLRKEQVSFQSSNNVTELSARVNALSVRLGEVERIVKTFTIHNQLKLHEASIDALTTRVDQADNALASRIIALEETVKRLCSRVADLEGR